MCGIMAWAGRSPKSFNKDKFNLLGTMNETRGTDSCGVSVDGEIYFGVDDTKKYRDFLAKAGYPLPKDIPIVIGHTRNSTVGSNSIANAHPFGFDNAKSNKDLYAFIGVHNGTLYNHKALAEEYKIEPTKKSSNAKNAIISDKIDSEILLEIIYRSAKFKVLSQYNGAAALVFYNVDDPDHIYAYHGASVKYIGGTDKALYIERELFAWQEHKNSLYISSQDHALMAIGATEETMIQFQTNVVYKIKHGNLATATKFSLSRSSQQHEKMVDYPKVKKDEPVLSNPLNNAYLGTGGAKAPAIPFRGSQPHIAVSSSANIHNDVKVETNTKKVSMEKLRYNRNGHGIDGIFVWVSGYGLHFVGYDLNEATTSFKNLIDREWYKGGFVHNEDVLIGSSKEDISVPFPSGAGFNKKDWNPMEIFHYFIDGVKIVSFMDWQAATELKKNGNGFSIQALSDISCHPIVDLTVAKKDNAQGIFFRGVLANSEGFTPLGSSKTYKIQKGNCVEISLIDAAEHRKPYSNLELIVQELETNEDNLAVSPADGSQCALVLSQETQSAQDKKALEDLKKGIDQDFLEKLIDELCLPAIEKFQQNRERLQKFKDTELGRDALILFQDFIKNASQLVAIELND